MPDLKAVTLASSSDGDHQAAEDCHEDASKNQHGKKKSKSTHGPSRPAGGKTMYESSDDYEIARKGSREQGR